MRLRHKVNVFVTDDAELECVLFGGDNADKELEQIDIFQRVVSGKFSIAGAGTEAIPLGDVDVPRGILIIADAAFDVIFNGGAETLNFSPADTQTGRKTRCFMEATITAASVTNPNATVALTGTYVVWGDPTP